MSYIQQALAHNILIKNTLDMRFKRQDAKKSLQRATIFTFVILFLWMLEVHRNYWMALFITTLCTLVVLNGVSCTIIYLRLFFDYYVKPNSMYAEPIEPIFKAEKANNLPLPTVSSLLLYKKGAINNCNEYPIEVKRKSKLNKVFCSTPILKSDFIADEKNLESYFRSCEERKKIHQLNLSMGRKYENYNKKSTAANLLKTSIYQLSSNFNENLGMVKKDHLVKTELINFLQTELMYSISIEQMIRYVSNIRHWISITIIKPIIQQIDFINKVFDQRGLINMRIGSTGLEQLHSLATHGKFIEENVPTLPALLTYLDICPNQIYLLETLRKLANGACMNDYSLKVDDIRLERMPNAAAIIFQCFCIYLDSQLESDFGQNICLGTRTFYNKYVIIKTRKTSLKQTIKKIQNSAKCAIVCTNLLRPEFNFLANDRMYKFSYSLNNLFHAIIAFLVYMKRTQCGMLEGVNLGKGGINILSVIET